MVAALDQLTTAQAARILAVSEQTVRAWVRMGKLPAQITALGALIDCQAVHDLAARRERDHSLRVRTRQVGP